MSKQLSRLKGYMQNRLETQASEPAQPVSSDTAPTNAPVPTVQETSPSSQNALPPSVRTMRMAVTRLGTIADETRAMIASGEKIVELDPEMVEDSSISDRLDNDPAKHQELVGSIRAGGQKVPIHVRPHPSKPGAYEIAYGRRRLRAAKELGRKVRAIVLNMSDEELVVAQGQENTARLDLTFIEKVAFAIALEDHKYSRDTIEAALSVDRTMAARMLALGRRLPGDIVRAIGSAPKAGRPRWTQLADLLEKNDGLSTVRPLIESPDFVSADTDRRFNMIIDALTKKPSQTGTGTWVNYEGRKVARIDKSAGKLKIVVDAKAEPDFAAYLESRLSDLYRDFSMSSLVAASMSETSA